MMWIRRSVFMLMMTLIHKTQGYLVKVSVVNILTGYSTVLPEEKRYDFIQAFKLFEFEYRYNIKKRLMKHTFEVCL